MLPLRPDAPLDRNRLPEPVLDRSPDLVSLYWAAWEMAWDHVVHQPGVPQSPYMDEAFDPDVVWIWDTCFMTHFCKYAPDLFPGIESLQNFYAPLHDGVTSALQIQHPDNPPLFAWAEEEYVSHTGDLERVDRVLGAGYLQKHFAWFDTVAPGTVLPGTVVPTAIERTSQGYRWGAIQSGMDNTPRAGEAAWYGNSRGGILWLDSMAQQALSARSIARLAHLVDRPGLAEVYGARHADLCAEPSSTTGTTGTRPSTTAGHRTLPVPARRHAGGVLAPPRRGLQPGTGPVAGRPPDRSPRSRRAGAVALGRAGRPGLPRRRAVLARRRMGPARLRERPGLADHGHGALARTATDALLAHLAATFADYSPATIWEAYAPVDAAPATDKDGRTRVRTSFCGWSALGPISMLIEHVLGFRVDATTQTVRWDPDGPGRQGIRRLRCGRTLVDAVADGDEVAVSVDHPITLVLDGRELALGAGRHVLARAQRST